MYKKAWCTCKVVVLLIKPIVFLRFSLPSASLDLKVPNALSSGTSLYRPYKGVPFPPEIRRRRIRETLHNVSTFFAGESLPVVFSMSGV